MRLVKAVTKAIIKDKSLNRTLTDLKLWEKEISLSGKILDLGSRYLYWKNGRPFGASYFKVIKFERKAEILRLDIDEQTNPDYKIDFEKDRLPFKNNSVDAILIFNVFEHIYNYQFLTKEIFRVLKEGGTVLGSVPFLHRVHPDPKDFFRYTKEALEKIFKGNNFKEINIDYIGYGPFVNQYSQIEFALPRILRLLLIFPVIILDKIVLKLKSKVLREKFPLGYLFILKK